MVTSCMVTGYNSPLSMNILFGPYPQPMESAELCLQHISSIIKYINFSSTVHNYNIILYYIILYYIILCYIILYIILYYIILYYIILYYIILYYIILY